MNLKTKLQNKGFILGIIGKPGCGKTTFIKNILTNELKEQFDYILLASPSSVEYNDIIPPKQLMPTLSLSTITKWINLINLSNKGEPSNVLIILDDVVSEVKDLYKNVKLTQLFYNRRHLLWNGLISIIITSQKYTMIPAKFRSVFTDVIFFNLSPFDVDKVFEESIIKYTKPEWKSKISKIFDKEYNSIHLDIDSQEIN